MVMVSCPMCGREVVEKHINRHIDSGCKEWVESSTAQPPKNSIPSSVLGFFQTPPIRRQSSAAGEKPKAQVDPQSRASTKKESVTPKDTLNDGARAAPASGRKRALENERTMNGGMDDEESSGAAKRPKTSKVNKASAFQRAAPLAERMRPKTLDEVYGQELVGASGVIRGLIEQERVPSMILWGGPGTGKTTIARLIAHVAGYRFVEINSTSSGVAECKKLFADAKSELALTGRKTIIFCDEIHRFSKSQQDVFLGPVEAGQVTLIGATTENPSFKVVDALLSRCRTFTLSKLTDKTVLTILKRALNAERSASFTDMEAGAFSFQNGSNEDATVSLPVQPPVEDVEPMSPTAPSKEKDKPSSSVLDSVIDDELLMYLASFADGDARTALNLLELAINMSYRENITKGDIKRSLTQTLVYDRAGDQHYDTISAFHKSIRGSDADAALYYLARMLQSGEDPLYIARRLMVVASEDIGLADNSMLSLAAAAYSAAEKIGMPECRINLAHATVAMSLSKKSTRAYRGLGNAMAALQEPGVAGLPIPIHLKNAPTKLMKELGYGKEYKYNPHYQNGEVAQQYLPNKLQGRTFLELYDLGNTIDPDLPG